MQVLSQLTEDPPGAVRAKISWQGFVPTLGTPAMAPSARAICSMLVGYGCRRSGLPTRTGSPRLPNRQEDFRSIRVESDERAPHRFFPPR